ncbi:hypothetical protein [Nostoc sp. WHI]|uniref:hypothetical protein n=1 Tax=Nostoc sp. WHI TaxID=2650611 RepID=UPI0018C7AC38|nr:hypothetical protein [Nostoc sp. WHI]
MQNLVVNARRRNFGSLRGDRIIFEVFCKAIALFLRFSVRRSLLINYRSIKLKHDYS